VARFPALQRARISTSAAHPIGFHKLFPLRDFFCFDFVFFLADLVTGMALAVSSLLVSQGSTEIQH
jgi:hypothetical protein